MMITLSKEITENNITIPKGSKGVVKAVQWGDKKDGFIVDFADASNVFVQRENLSIVAEAAVNLNKKKELPKPTCGKGSE